MKQIAVGVVLVVLGLELLSALPKKSPTADEYCHHIPAGVSYVKTGDFRLNPANPPLPRMIAGALPALFGARIPYKKIDVVMQGNVFNWVYGGPEWFDGNIRDYSNEFWRLNDISKFTYLARLPFIVLSMIFGLCLYVWCKKLWGYEAGIISLMVYSFTPDILAHSMLATSDMTVSFFFFLTVTRFQSYLNKPSVIKLGLIGLFAGLTFLSKFSAILLIPIIITIYFVSGKRVLNGMKVILISFVAFLTIWAGYGFEYKPLLTDTPQSDKKVEVYKHFGLDEFAREVPVPAPKFISGFTSMMATHSKGGLSYFMGKWSENGGFKLYYIVAFLIKNTIPFLIMFAVGLGIMCFYPLDKMTMATLLVPIATMFLVTINDHAQVGIRYFLPIYPFVIAIGAFGMTQLWGWFRWLLPALHIILSLVVAPNWFSYFNGLVLTCPTETMFVRHILGPVNWLRDSNLDWGQDLIGLSGMKDIVLDYPWPVPPKYYGITYRMATEAEKIKPGNEVYAISSQFIDFFEWTWIYYPTKVIGGSIFIYDFKHNKKRSPFYMYDKR